MTGKMAKSLYGHDAGKVYMIVGEEDGFVYLANGSERTLKCPKKKNKKHIQVIKNIPDEVGKLIRSEICDLNLKRAIKIYQKTDTALNE